MKKKISDIHSWLSCGELATSARKHTNALAAARKNCHRIGMFNATLWHSVRMGAAVGDCFNVLPRYCLGEGKQSFERVRQALQRPDYGLRPWSYRSAGLINYSSAMVYGALSAILNLCCGKTGWLRGRIESSAVSVACCVASVAGFVNLIPQGIFCLLGAAIGLFYGIVAGLVNIISYSAVYQINQNQMEQFSKLSEQFNQLTLATKDNKDKSEHLQSCVDRLSLNVSENIKTQVHDLINTAVCSLEKDIRQLISRSHDFNQRMYSHAELLSMEMNRASVAVYKKFAKLLQKFNTSPEKNMDANDHEQERIVSCLNNIERAIEALNSKYMPLLGIPQKIDVQTDLVRELFVTIQDFHPISLSILDILKAIPEVSYISPELSDISDGSE